MSLTLANATYWRNDGYPMLGLEVDGRRANLAADCKPVVFDAGITFLGPKFVDRVEPIVLEAEGMAPIRLEGFTRDARVHRLYAAFLKAAGEGTFEEGPGEIPA